MGSRFALRFLPAVFAIALGIAGPAHAAPLSADLDRDGVFDDLEAVARSATPSASLRVLVRLDADATRTRARGLEQRVDTLDVERRFGVVDAVAARVDARDVRALAAAPGVVAVSEDAVVHATNASAQTWFGVTEARLDLPSLNGDADGSLASYSPADMVAAVIDTGIYAGHPNLDGGKVLAFQDFTDGSSTDVDTPVDDNGHGTHVSGTIAGDAASGDGRGVAPGAGLVGLKVLDANGNGYSSDVIAAIDWVWKDPDGGGPAVSNGATYGIEAINLSLGAQGCSNGTDPESQAVNNAAAAGYVVAVAAGNDGPAGCTGSSGISSPAAAAQAITVGAMADVDQSGFYLASFSSRGPTLDGRVKPDIAAPGVGIRSTNNSGGFSTYSGTSMATPFVAGVALLMRQLNPSLTAAQVKQRMMDTAVDWGSTGADSDYGAGRLDAYAALAAASPSTLELSTPPTSLPPYQRHASSLPGAGATQVFTVTRSGSFPLTLGLTVGASGANFDMYLRAPGGTLVASATSTSRQDELHLPSGSGGPYTLEVRSVSGSGAFFLDVSGGSAVSGLSNVAAPAVTGDARDGATLSATPGTWQGADPITYAYSWERCDESGNACAAVSDASSAHVLGPADIGRRMRVVVTATNPSGTVSVASAVGAPVAAIPTVNTGAPAIAGAAVRGKTLTADDGAWSGSQLALSREWLRCHPDGTACVPIAGATGASYLPTSADVGFRLRLRVRGTGPGGTTTAESYATEIVTEPPANTIAPSLSGTARDGQRLSVRRGSWTGSAPLEYRHRWSRCDGVASHCVRIHGADSAQYELTPADVGHRLVATEVVSNVAGSVARDTVASAVVRAAPPALRKRPSVTGRASAGQRLHARMGAWSGTPRLRFAVAWFRCDASGRHCRQVARGRTYSPTAADESHRVRARVVARNEAGRRTALSRATRLVRP